MSVFASKNPKSMVCISTLLVVLVIFSFICIGFPENLFAAELDKAKDTAIDESTEVVDMEIFYPAMQEMPSSPEKGSSDGNGVFMKHVIHMPKSNKTDIMPAPNLLL